MNAPVRIGIDLDNTIIDYSDVFRGKKREVRDALRSQGPEGELAWRQLQREVYTSGMAHARLAEGCAAFLRRCHATPGMTVFIVSHKTEELREAARGWLSRHAFFAPDGLALSAENLYFAATRREKIDRIRALGCDVFIDDLAEVLDDPDFPPGVRKILFSTWREVERAVFGRGRNSAVRRVEIDGTAYAEKRYPEIGSDTRDRFGTERNALQLFERHGIACVPRWRRGEANVAWLEWIEGSPVDAPTAEDIDAVAGFIAEVKALAGREPDGGAALPLASEACLSGEEILRQIHSRHERLRDRSGRFDSLANFVSDRALAEAAARAAYRDAGLDFAVPLPLEHRSLIPADLGFHNALRDDRSGRLVFFDFEYFGWDDPVKLTADFVLHPGHTLDDGLEARFVGHMQRLFGGDETFTVRLHALLPLYRLRWALIVRR